MHYAIVLRLLALLLLANGSPVVATMLLGRRLAGPLDGRIKFLDGRRLLGESKTKRGVLLSVLVTSMAAPLVGFPFGIGFLVGATTMAGDLTSSFCKRRLGLRPGSRAIGLDQIPESLLPFLACRSVLSLTGADLALGVATFVVADLALSRLLFHFRLRDRP